MAGGGGLTLQRQTGGPKVTTRSWEARARWDAPPTGQVNGLPLTVPPTVHLAGHTPLLTQPAQPAGFASCGMGWGTGGGGRLWEAEPLSLTRVGDKGLCWAAAKGWQTKGPGGRMNHQPLSASFVLGWASLNSAELSRSGQAVISIQLAWLTGPAGQEVLCTGVWVKPSLLRPSLPAASYRAGFPSHSSQPGFGRSLVVNTSVTERDCCSPGPQQGMRAVGAASERKSSPLTEGLAQGHSQDSTWPGTGPPPARIALRKRRGATGRGQELPAPAWAGRHTGRNVPSSAGPPSACRLPHPGIAECNPRAGRGCSLQRQQAPLQPPAFTLLLRTKGSQGNLGVCM